jgi:hypothetical protein
VNQAKKIGRRVVVVFFSSVALSLLFSIAFGLVARPFGFLFGGLSSDFVVFVVTGFCSITIPVIAFFCERKGKRLSWFQLVAFVITLAFTASSLMSWLDTRQHLKIFLNPKPVPPSLRVCQGCSILFSSYVHFTAPPEVIAAIIQSKELVEIPIETPDQVDISGYSERERTKVSWDWWQPTTMSNPRFYYRHHKSEAVQGWSEGWWVNGATNEVYALIGG